MFYLTRDFVAALAVYASSCCLSVFIMVVLSMYFERMRRIESIVSAIATADLEDDILNESEPILQ